MLEKVTDQPRHHPKGDEHGRDRHRKEHWGDHDFDLRERSPAAVATTPHWSGWDAQNASIRS
jgi:hypothetical protein